MKEPMKYFSQSMTLLGKVTNVNVAEASFTLRCRSGDSFLVQASANTTFMYCAIWTS